MACLLDGEKMPRLCDEFGISRKTGYEIFKKRTSTYRDWPIGVTTVSACCPQAALTAIAEEAETSVRATCFEIGTIIRFPRQGKDCQRTTLL